MSNPRKVRKMTDRQANIIKFIAECKKAGRETINIDEILDHLRLKGDEPVRNSMIVSMNIIVRLLEHWGVYFKKQRSVGRGKTQSYLIRRKP
jgi:hypothetical protein